MLPLLLERLDLSFSLYDELAAHLDPSVFRNDLAGLPSNTIGAQFWCVIGARESYALAIENGAWSGFRCSLDGKLAGEKAEVMNALTNSRETARHVLKRIQEPNETQIRLALQLLEHESQHHGQLIRYLYGLKIAVPKGWKERYHLD
jgi:hypothetical protein